jgi:hypothetical protein
MAESVNVCAGPFGAVYDFYIEREWLSRIVGRAVWGVDVSPMYASMSSVGRMGTADLCLSYSGLHDLCRWLAKAGITEPMIEPEHGFVVFRGHKNTA